MGFSISGNGKRKVRKPRDLIITWTDCGQGMLEGFSVCEDNTVIGSVIPPNSFNAKDCRKLAKWLTSAADYLEQQEVNREG